MTDLCHIQSSKITYTSPKTKFVIKTLVSDLLSTNFIGSDRRIQSKDSRNFNCKLQPCESTNKICHFWIVFYERITRRLKHNLGL